MITRTTTNNAAQRLRALSLYRQILNVGHNWEHISTGKINTFHKKIFEKQFITREQETQDFSKGKEEIENEKQYIKEQAKKLFRENKNLTNQREIESKIDLAEKRLLITLHYGIPYERPEHVNLYDNYWRGELNLNQAEEEESSPAFASTSSQQQYSLSSSSSSPSSSFTISDMVDSTTEEDEVINATNAFQFHSMKQLNPNYEEIQTKKPIGNSAAKKYQPASDTQTSAHVAGGGKEQLEEEENWQ